MSQITPPPTYADPVVADEKTGKSQFNPLWLKWFLDIAAYVSANGGTSGAVNHEGLAGLQGGASNDHSHLTAAQAAAIIAIAGYGVSGTGGQLVRQTGASFTDTPSFGNSAALVKTSVSMNNGAAAAAGTLLNAPVAGNPTKWVPINDNGIVRYVPCW